MKFNYADKEENKKQIKKISFSAIFNIRLQECIVFSFFNKNMTEFPKRNKTCRCMKIY